MRQVSKLGLPCASTTHDGEDSMKEGERETVVAAVAVASDCESTAHEESLL